MRETIKKSIVWSLVFSFTTFTIFVVYALVDSVWTNPTTLEVWAGSWLSATSWNKLLSNFNNLNDKVSNFTFSSWKVWIWTTPTDTLTVNGWITSTTGWSNIASATWWSTTNITCRKIWSFLQIRKHANSATSDVTPAWSTNIWTLPVECRPSVGIYIPSTCWSNWYIVSGCLTFIDTDGKIYIYTSSSMYYISFAWTYPAN